MATLNGRRRRRRERRRQQFCRVLIEFNISLIFYFILTCICVSSFLSITNVSAMDNSFVDELEFASLDGVTKLYTTNTPSKTPDLRAFKQLEGGEIVGERRIRLAESPYNVLDDIRVEKDAKLIIEAGVTIEFAPGTGITVLGILEAVGTPTSRITLSSSLAYHNGLPQASSEWQQLPHPEDRRARLVDGPTPLEGRLQIFYKGSWRSVCTNSRRWMPIDFEISCKQMGFRGGQFWNWVDKSEGYKPRILYEEPKCNGTEDSLLKCPNWRTRQLGSGACDYHSDLGIQCLPVHSQAMRHWRGLYFQNAPSSKRLNEDNTVYSDISHSILKYIDILEAGSGPSQTMTSALQVLGVPPVMENVTVTDSAYTGINITLPKDGFTLKNVTVQKSNGIGIFINTSRESVELERCQIVGNAADGVKYIGHDLRPEERTDRANIHEFCTLPFTSGQSYPISLSFTQKYYAASAKECEKYFFARSGYRLTLHFEYFSMQRNESARIEIYDGASSNEKLLFSWKARNYTRPQSVTSTREKIFIRMKAEAFSEVNGFLRLSTSTAKAYDLRITKSVVEDNAGRGVAADNIRSGVQLDECTVTRNGHVSGVHISSGVGDVNVTNSLVGFNKGDGINITYYGGNRNVSRSVITSNKGFGVAVWLNDTKDVERIEYTAINQSTVVEYSEFYGNIENGINHGNYCDPIWINITGNTFNTSLMNAVQIESCWQRREPNEPNLHLQIGHNMFENSKRIGIFLSPALSIRGRIEFNQFRYSSYGCIYIKIKPLIEEFNYIPVSFVIQSNYFIRNRGIYVVSLALSPYSKRDIQSLLFTRNFLRENKIAEPFGPQTEASEGTDGAGRLNPRSMVAAPVVVGSSNVDIFRNILHNLDSRYEIGSQLCDQSQIINATYNWLGHTDEKIIYGRLFHRNDRYNLAKIEYIPYLLHNSNPSSTTIISISTLVPRFYQEGVETIGGEIDGQEMIPAGSYTVNKDINIRPGGKLILQPGVILKFQPSVGMMVAGKIEARGRRPDDILFTLKRETIMPTDNQTSLNDEQEVMEERDEETGIDIKTESLMKIEGASSPRMTSVRLVGGSGEYEGRLQIHLEGRWGTVCDYGWTITNAALVCHQLGYTLNPYDWHLLRSQLPNHGITEDILVSNVRCTEQDRDITECRSERLDRGEFENACTHDNDVGIRCYEGAWAGIRFSMLSERADLQYVTVEKAGLFDYSTNSFKPAIQMDFARHNLENVRIVNNLNDGLGIIYSDIFGGKSVNNVRNSEFIENRGDGISLKQLGLRIHGSVIKNNRGSGIGHDPTISAFDQKEIGGWFYMARDFNTFDSEYNPYLLPLDQENIDLDTWQTKYIRTEEVAEPTSLKVYIRCPVGYVLGIQLLNPVQNRSTENITILDSHTENSRSQIWSLRNDLNVFPTTSSSYGLVLYYNSGLNALGGAVLLLSTVPAPVREKRSKSLRGGGPVPLLSIRSTKIQNNLRGISAYYYNRYLGHDGELFLRKANESIKIANSEISFNKKEAFYVKSPFWDVHSSNLSEITIHINSSIITENGRGIRQVSKDLRSSNNLFHYVLQDTTVESNSYGGFEIALPYVWQYNENFTHSIYFGNSTWQRNRNFRVAVVGHYAVFNITSNLFNDNQCSGSVVRLDGMEKRIQFENNRFERNSARYILEFQADSQSEIIGIVPAMVEYNTIRNNNYEIIVSHENSPDVRHGSETRTDNKRTAVIRFDGIQNVRIYRNSISQNQMDYDLIAGVKSARLNNYFYATENWWGSTDSKYIKERIFDFSNWNDHAEVVYEPFLIEDNFESSVSLTEEEKEGLDPDSWTGGRIFKDFTLKRRYKPYLLKSDITVMPGVTLTIQHGVQLEFESNVGILVLGTMIAIGYKESPIIMRPSIKKSDDHAKIKSLKRSVLGVQSSSISHDSIRLCTSSQNCSTKSDFMDHNVGEGFLEYFNHTTLQWVPICDNRFTERNAQVVCRELGFEPLNVYYDHDRRIEFHTNSLARIWTWVQPLECRGNELRLEECSERLNGQVYGRKHECRWDGEFVFISCRGKPGEQTYWGGIRFANSDFEDIQYDLRYHDTHTHSNKRTIESNLEYVRLENAGLLHGEKSAAIQSLFKSPQLISVSIINPAYHGVNIIGPTSTITLNYLNISNALGNGINILSLTGEGRESDESSFTPLKNLDLPYKLFSMLDMCDPQKVLTVEEKILVYYKYDNSPANCVKIFNSVYKSKPIGFRLLQSNLFNHTKLYGRTDTIRLFDGDLYNVTSVFLGRIEADTTNQRSFFKTTGPTLSLQLIASGAPERYGFIAEIVTIPISTIRQNRDTQHNITYSHITNSMRGALVYSSVGEISPTLTLLSNRIENNCKQLYGNFSTCESAINIDVQNMQSFYLMNNLLLNNQGGLRIRADSRGSATSLRGFLLHNLFLRNYYRPTLFVEGRQSSPYQEIEVFRNYFAQNNAEFEDVIRLRQVVSNFTYNFVHSNIGGRILDISGFDKVRLPIYQTTSHNGFYGNIATNINGRTTVVAGTAGQQYVDNIFENPDNDYEMITVNNSISNELWRSKIDARHNYWSYNNSISVQSRIRDQSDDPLLLEVQVVPFQMNNQSILDGKCPPGFNLVHDTCFIYVAAPMNFYEAKEFCRSENSSVPFIRTDSTTLWTYLQGHMQHMKYPEKVWIQDLNHIDRCTSFVFREVEVEDCNQELGFICEIDPKVVIDPLSWRADIFAISIISAFILAIILLIMVAFCWYAKSKHRHVQRLERRNSIRQSLRSLNSIDPQGSLRRRNLNMSSSTGTLTKSLAQDYKQMMMMTNGSYDSMDKSVLSSEGGSYDAYENNGAQQNDYQDTYHHHHQPNVNGVLTSLPGPQKTATIGSATKNARSYLGKPGSGMSRSLGSETAESMTTATPTFELSYRNQGFRDNSMFSGPRKNSLVQSIAEDTPIIHHSDLDEAGSDYYGNASTLPLRSADEEKLKFLKDLKQSLPEYEAVNYQTGQSSFLPPQTISSATQHHHINTTDSTTMSQESHTNTLPYEEKIDNLNFSALTIPSQSNSNDDESIIRHGTDKPYLIDIRRPDSYYTAVRSSKAGPQVAPASLGQGVTGSRGHSTNQRGDVNRRPKTVYHTANEDVEYVGVSSLRSKSEALLETDFDCESPSLVPLQTSNRSYSQPLETAM